MEMTREELLEKRIETLESAFGMLHSNIGIIKATHDAMLEAGLPFLETKLIGETSLLLDNVGDKLSSLYRQKEGTK